jgi:hypothetical protein
MTTTRRDFVADIREPMAILGLELSSLRVALGQLDGSAVGQNNAHISLERALNALERLDALAEQYARGEPSPILQDLGLEPTRPLKAGDLVTYTGSGIGAWATRRESKAVYVVVDPQWRGWTAGNEVLAYAISRDPRDGIGRDEFYTPHDALTLVKEG